jgi:GNAT superfamily N-acetyltransferase
VVFLAPTPEDRAKFLERETADYADAKARAGMWPAEDALVRARKEIAEVLAQPGPHEILKAIDAKGREVGWVWVGPVPEANSPSTIRWLYQITVEKRLRGRGYGRALLAATERWVRGQGASELRLNVFAWNQVAISLYESSGYEVAERAETNLEMRKRLS